MASRSRSLGWIGGPDRAFTTDPVQQLGLDPVAQNKLLVAGKLAELRHDVEEQVVQFRQDIVAGCHWRLLH